LNRQSLTAFAAAALGFGCGGKNGIVAPTALSLRHRFRDKPAASRQLTGPSVSLFDFDFDFAASAARLHLDQRLSSDRRRAGLGNCRA
jgi:hypothetical protein